VLSTHELNELYTASAGPELLCGSWNKREEYTGEHIRLVRRFYLSNYSNCLLSNRTNISDFRKMRQESFRA